MSVAPYLLLVGVLIAAILLLSVYILSPLPNQSTAFATFPGENGKIAFIATRDEDNQWHIYIMNAGGSKETRLTNNPANDFEPEWSPDGKRIVFTRNIGEANDNNYEIYVMNADGTNRTRLTNNPADDSYPDWSPDGKKIAFMSNRVDPPSNKYEIYVMNAADGSGKTNISNNPGHDGTPSWSPDGEKIAFLCEREHNNEICIMNADGSEQTNMTNNNDNDAQPDWGTATGTEPSEGVR